MSNKKTGIVVDYDFTTKHNPAYPHPVFLSFENPRRIKVILDHFDKINLWTEESIIKLVPKIIDEKILSLAHSQYHIQTIRSLSRYGSGLLGEEVFITNDTFDLAKKAVGGVIEAFTSIIENRVHNSLALVRPPGHHALKEKSSGLCIFNNIANAVMYLREELKYQKKIAIIDIDDHFGDGIARFFYEDPSVLYFSVHEFDFIEGEIGFINELGAGKGLGKSINFPIPIHSTEDMFFESMDIIEPILKEFGPDLIIIALGFDMYFNDPIGNCYLTSHSYYKFGKDILKLANQICDGRVSFILEGGYSLIGLPICTHAIIKALLGEEHTPYFFEELDFSQYSEKQRGEILKIKTSLKKILKRHWKSI
jgi:acetoin utilization deacetylase AcuC-like enzyme